jgi:hypothetical protein
MKVSQKTLKKTVNYIRKMETDIGNPIEYDPTVDPLNNEKMEEDIQDERQYYNDYSMQVPSTFASPPPPPQSEKSDFFSTIDKSTWIIAFAVFLLGFFMGKTMQPVILRYT